MNKFLLCACALALAAPPVLAADQDGAPPTRVEIVAKRDAEWASYRHAYKAASRFEKITRSRPLIQAHMQILPLKEGLSLAGLRIELAGERTSLEIAVDPIGRATVPMLKTAFDEDAVLRLNRQRGNYRFSGRFSIRENDSGMYGAPELRAACEQLLSAQRESGSSFRLMGKTCVAVTFVYPLAGASEIAFRDVSGKPAAIAAVDGTPFDRAPMGSYKVATYRFDAWPAQGDIVAVQRPLFIGAVYE